MQQSSRLSLVKFILMHPCTLFQSEGEQYISNIRSHSHTKVKRKDVDYAHCVLCHTPLVGSEVFIELLVKFLLRGIYISATDVLFALRGETSLHCDLIGHHPVSGAVFVVFFCTHREDLRRTWVHARRVVFLLETITPTGGVVNAVVIPLYTYVQTQKLIFYTRPRIRMSRREANPVCMR